MDKTILAGTTKGLVEFEPVESTWKINRVHFNGMPVSMIFVDEVTGYWWVGLDHKHWGPKLHFSENHGKTWQENNLPDYQQTGTSDARLKRIWVMNNADFEAPGQLWIGTEPGGLFFSKDNGKRFSLNRPLWLHPSRVKEKQWFGAGRDYPFIHSIALNPKNNKNIFISVSCAGVFETKDGGESWSVKNKGLKATYLPNPHVETGHDPHALFINKKNPDIIWQQNHCGIFRSTDGGDHWQPVSREGEIPHYGFAMVIDEDDPECAWVIPAESDEKRVAAKLQLAVYYTCDGGKSWIKQNHGLPTTEAFDIVLRHAFIKFNNQLVFGTNNGNVYFSENLGNNWELLSFNLAPVNCMSWA